MITRVRQQVTGTEYRAGDPGGADIRQNRRSPGKRVQFKVISIYGIKNGKLAEYWGLQDEFSLKQQLGVIEQDDISDSD